jgi:hypothetical protein
MGARAASGRSGISLPWQGRPAQPGKLIWGDNVGHASLDLRVAFVEHPASGRRIGRVVLRDGAGEPCAYGGKVSGRYWVYVPKVGSFEFSAGDSEVRGSVYPDTSRELVLDGYYGTALPLFAQGVLGYEVLHASAVVVDGGAVAFCAETGIGKSTIGSALSSRGFPRWADDAVAVVGGRSPVSVFLPFMIEGQTISAVDGWSEVPLAAVCLLERASRPAILRPSPSDAVAALFSHAYRFAPQPAERRRQMAQTYLDVVAEVPILLVRFPPNRDQLPTLLARIESAVRDAVSEGG